jgi:hypothetical protein
MHLIENPDLSELNRGHGYFGVSLILGNGRHALLMLVSVYPFSAPGMYTYMQSRLLLLDRRCVFKGSCLFCMRVHLLFKFLT